MPTKTALSIALAVAAGSAAAQDLLVVRDFDRDPSQDNARFGYGGEQFTEFTGLIDDRFDSVTVHDTGGGFNHNSFDAMWIELRDFRDTFTAAELVSLNAFVDSGRPVYVQGENNIWATWNSAIADFVGGDFVPVGIGAGAEIAAEHPVTDGLLGLVLATPAGGRIGGGRPLAWLGGTRSDPLPSTTLVAAFGPQENVIVNMDLLFVDPFLGGSNGNDEFGISVADWLASVPAPATSVLFVGFASLMVRRVR